jgi:hypothetical protein
VSKLAVPKQKDKLWHRRLCHRSTGFLKKNLSWLHGTDLQSSDFVRGELDEECHCEACARTKSTKAPRKIHSRHDRRSHKGEIATDLYGPFPEPTLQGSYHLQIFVRVESGYGTLYGCTRKNSSVKNLSEYLKTWPPPRTTHYHADGARELVGADIQKILDGFTPKISITYSTPYSPNQNSYAERMWRTLIDMAHPNILMAALPFRFIESAMEYAVWVANRLPRQTDQGWMSPFEYEFGYPPDLQMARRWGCTCYYHVPSQLRRKGDIENGIKSYFMGISEKQPYGWVVWDPKLNDFITSSNVYFVESIDEDTKASIKNSSKIRELDFYSREFSEEGKSPADFKHLLGVRYFDFDEREVFETTSIVERGQVIVANRKKVVRGKLVGNESDYHCVHVRDVESMIEETKTKDRQDLCAAALVTREPPQVIPYMSSQSDPDLLSTRSGPPKYNQAAHRGFTSLERDRQRRIIDDRRLREAVPSGLPDFDIGKASKGGKEQNRPTAALPKGIQSAMKSSKAEKWYPKMAEEIDCIFKKSVWFQWFRALPPGVKPLGTKFVFKVKEKDEPEDDVYRARLVVQGFDQILGVDFFETFSPTTKANSLRLLLYFVLLFDMTIPIHLDAVKAYMNSDIDTDIWVYPPHDPDEVFFKKGTVFKLKKALYGLKQSGRLWHQLVDDMLKKLGFKNLKSEPCFYYSVTGNVLTFIIVYVDDLLITSQSTEVRDILIKKMMKVYEFTNEGQVSDFLGIRISFYIDEFNRYITMDQEKMIQEKIEEFQISQDKPAKVPMDPELRISIHDEPAAPNNQFREMIGSALHIARWTRCDISNTVSQLSRLNSKPTIVGVRAARKLWSYLGDTAHLKFKLSLSNVRKVALQMVGLTDANWAGCIDTRRSTTGWMIFIGLALINWISQLQSFVAQSSMESETIAANKLLNELLYQQGMFIEAGLLPESQTGTPMMIDNEAAIKAANNPVGHGKTKHFDIQQFHLRENTASGRVVPTKIHTSLNTADLLTKALPRPTLEFHRKRAGIVELGPSAKKARSDEDWKRAARGPDGDSKGRSSHRQGYGK